MGTILSASEAAPFRVRTNRTGRRTYSREYKLQIIEQCSAPEASLAAVALSHGINANVVRKWVVQYRAGLLSARLNKPMMLPVSVETNGTCSPPASAKSRQGAPGVIEIELDAARIRVRGGVDVQALRTVLEAFAKR